MYRDLFKIFVTFSIIIVIATESSAVEQHRQVNVSRIVEEESSDGKSSLVFVFDTTGSMHNDLAQLRAGAELILDTALESRSVIADFVFVPFHDPAVGPATVTRDKEALKAALNKVHVYGGGDCPENSLGGIQMALNVSRPRSFVYVFTDATAKDHRLAGAVLDMVQRKQTLVVFVLTGHCEDLDQPSYKVYSQIAAASSGQVFNLNKTSVHKVLDFVRSSIRGRTVNLGSASKPAGQNFTQSIPVDVTLGEVTVSVSGARPQIRVVNPNGREVTGPPQLVTTIDLSEIMVVKVLQPEMGNWSISVGSEEDYTVRVVGLSNLTFEHGFSVERPTSMAETSYRPLRGTYNYMTIKLSETESKVHMNYAEILSLGGKTLFEVRLREVAGAEKTYLSDAFIPPEEFFYIAINGRDEYNQDVRRIGATAVQSKQPDVPYLTTISKIQAHPHERVVLRCRVESLVPVTSVWAKDAVGLAPKITTLQSTSIEYVIEDLTADKTGKYRCYAKNIAGQSHASASVAMLVEPPTVSVSAAGLAADAASVGEPVSVTCAAHSAAPLTAFRLVFNGTAMDYVKDLEAVAVDGEFFTSNMTIQRASDADSGLYTCVAANKEGQANQSMGVTIQPPPTARILNGNTTTVHNNTGLRLLCNVGGASVVYWEAPNNTVVGRASAVGSYNASIAVHNVTEDGNWTCVAMKRSLRASDTIRLNVISAPKVTIEGGTNVTVVYGAEYYLVCNAEGKPEPETKWLIGTNATVASDIHSIEVKPNVYQSVLKLNTSRQVSGEQYRCSASNAAGESAASVAVNIRSPMVVVEAPTNKSVRLYTSVDFHCEFDSYPRATIKWYHNGTEPATDGRHVSPNGTVLRVERVDFDDLGVYSCAAENGYESVTLNATLTLYGLEYPLLSKESNRTVTQIGRSANITCRLLKGSPEPTIKWQFRSETSTLFADLPPRLVTDPPPSVVTDPPPSVVTDPHPSVVTDLRNAVVGSRLVVSNASVAHAGVYRCIAESAIGRDALDTELVVQYPPQLLSPSPKAEEVIQVAAGDHVTLSCKAAGAPPPVVVWSKDTMPVTFTNHIYLSALDSSELVFDNLTVDDSGVYSCDVINIMGSIRRNYTIFVYKQPAIDPPGVEPQLHTSQGQLAALPCRARGAPAPAVHWRHNGELVVNNRGKIIDEYGLRFVANLTDFGDYVCTARNLYGVTSLNYTLYVWVAPYIEAPLEIEMEVLSGKNTSLQCDAVGFPVPIILWTHQDILITENSTELSFNEIGNLYINNASSKHEGTYSCIAENLAGVARKDIYLNVNEPPTILEDTYNGTYIASNMDTSLVIACQATGRPTPYVIWSKDGSRIGKDARYEVGLDGSLTIKWPTEELSGVYTCVARNAVGNSSKAVPVEIYSQPMRTQADVGAAGPGAGAGAGAAAEVVEVVEGTDLRAECPVRAGRADRVQWYKDARLIAQGVLKLSNVSRGDAATYACVVSNAVGAAHAQLAVAVRWAPRFAREPPRRARLVRGDDLYLECAADAMPAAKTQWYFNGKPLVSADGYFLKLLNTQPSHAGAYRCVVGNELGTLTRQFTVDVLVPPFISEFDFLDVQLKEGVNATLECIARGNPKPEVSWTFNNTNWRVRNSTLSSVAVTSDSGGVFRCAATNGAGAAHLAYRVAVLAPPAVAELVLYAGGGGLTVVGGAATAVLGSRIRLACMTTGNPPPTVRWIRYGNTVRENTVNITYADLVLNNVQAKDSGLYSCVASNEGGVSERNIKLDVLEPPIIFQTLFQNGNSTSNTIHMEVISGQPFYLHCHPYGNPLPDVYWFKDSQPLKLYDDTMLSKDYSEVIFSPRSLYEQTGNYTCVARNEVGNTSVVYLVDVLVPPPAPKESAKPVTVRAGSQLSISCPVEGVPLPDVVWIRQPYTEITKHLQRIDLADNNYTLIINDTQVADNGKYSCIMTNKVGTTEVVFDVTVEEPPYIAGSELNGTAERHVVPLRRSVVLKCEASGHPTPNIIWLKDTQPVGEARSNVQLALGGALLALWGARAADGGRYACVASSAAGRAQRRYHLLVQVPGKWSPWSQWSLCNVTCGLGYQQRYRACQYIDDDVTLDNTSKSDSLILDESECRGVAVDKRKCHMPSCEAQVPRGPAAWSVWSAWAACSATCGAGTQARTRRCRGARCGGDNVQIRKCPNLPACEDSVRSKNDVYTSDEDQTERNPYLPEATFELQPDVIDAYTNGDVDDFYIRSAVNLSAAYHEVRVTANLDPACDPGYRHNAATHTCDDIDECALSSNACHATQLCANTAGAYRCACAAGYAALGAGQRCLDINECELDVDGCEYACVNVAGGYVCACPRPLRLHVDKHHCVAASMYSIPYAYQDHRRGEEYMSAAFQSPPISPRNNRNL